MATASYRGCSCAPANPALHGNHTLSRARRAARDRGNREHLVQRDEVPQHPRALPGRATPPLAADAGAESARLGREARPAPSEDRAPPGRDRDEYPPAVGRGKGRGPRIWRNARGAGSPTSDSPECREPFPRSGIGHQAPAPSADGQSSGTSSTESGRERRSSSNMPTYDTNFGAKRAREARERLGLDEGSPVACVLDARGAAGAIAGRRRPHARRRRRRAVERRQRALVWVNASQAVERKRFTVAHELGHVCCRHGDTPVDSQATISGHTHDPREVQANAFAAELLAPRAGVKGMIRPRPGTRGRRAACGALRRLDDRCAVSLQHARAGERPPLRAAQARDRRGPASRGVGLPPAGHRARHAGRASRSTRGCPTRWRGRRSPRCCAARPASKPPPRRPGAPRAGWARRRRISAARRPGRRGTAGRARPWAVARGPSRPARAPRGRLRSSAAASGAARNIACPGAAAGRRPPARIRSAPDTPRAPPTRSSSRRDTRVESSSPRSMRPRYCSARSSSPASPKAAVTRAARSRMRRPARSRSRGSSSGQALGLASISAIAPAKAGSALIAASASDPYSGVGATSSQSSRRWPSSSRSAGEARAR